MHELRLIKSKKTQRLVKRDEDEATATIGTPKFQESPQNIRETAEGAEVVEKVKKLINQIRKTRND
jgi:formylmethanofuran dehydrogenase subunit D